MGLQLEMNWYLVLKKEPQKVEHVVLDEHSYEQLVVGHSYKTVKSNFRIYPVGGVVPIIENDKATGLAHITNVEHYLNGLNQPSTAISFDRVMDLSEDPVSNHYTDLYLAYKKKQEIEDHGGKFKLADWVNALHRRNFEEALNNVSD